ncbi:MAG: hypothetical protein R6W90_01565 [Ignavibacteriaceae bacterium]
MKDKLIYIVAFTMAFLLVTGGFLYLNTIYKNIFAFDFTPVNAQTEEPVEDTDESEQKEETKQEVNEPEMQEEPEGIPVYINTDSIKIAMRKNSADSSALKDSVVVKKDKSVVLEDSIKNLKQQIKEIASKKDQILEAKIDSLKLASKISVADSSYKAWIKKTVSLYEAMDSRKAAKIILTYSDNIAKDILYSMKKKKAAEILAQYSPETVNRITSIK